MEEKTGSFPVAPPFKIKELVIRGVASKKIVKRISVSIKDLDKNLLAFLLSYNLPVAHACDGEGICKTCRFNTDQISCQMKVKELSNCELFFDYL